MDGRARGFTYIEMLVVVVLMGVMALAATPYVHHKYRRMQELELKRALKTMRAAIDRYHEYAVLGQIEPPDLDWNMYPESLDELVEGVEVQSAPDKEPVVVQFLRSIPIDPITGEAEWSCRGYEDDADERSSSCDDIYDVFSSSEKTALDGTYYQDW
ncbi:MAG: prepilin-type N-terminal cleavage/methylation domain-containing protein [Acidobacteria bacterium]|nr:prepilin-type N-terminal cleavage/methylation domain-containing protein [Acidobacteriota bacterium]